MSNKTDAKAPLTTTSTGARTGVLPSVVYLAIDVADRTSATAIALLQDARVELRKAAQRIDDASAETLTSLERTVAGVAISARDTVRAAADLSAAAANSVTGERAAA